jgi:large subunit ribosomal protein L13
MKIVDFDNAVLGRASTQVAKALLLGDDVVVVNCEKAIVKGNPASAVEKFQRRYDWRTKGNPVKRGPKYSRLPDRIVTWSIRHMLPYHKPSGQAALDRLTVCVGVPKRFEAQKAEKLPGTQNTELKRFLTIGQISQRLGLQTVKKQVKSK